MAKSDAQKKTWVMAKEWWKSKSNEQTIEDLVNMGVLHNKELIGWRAPKGEGYPIHNQVRSWCSRISLNGDLEF